MSKKSNSPAQLLEYVDQLIEKLRAMVPRAIKDGDETAIHQARVATRRLKAAMDVFKPVSSKVHRKELTRVLSKLRKNLGPARDVDVMLGHLKQIHGKPLEPGVKWLVGQLSQRQLASKQAAADEIDVPKAMSRIGAWWCVRQQWFEAGEKLDELVCQSLHAQLDEFVEHADAMAGRKTAHTDSHMLDPHQLRISGKALRYTLEMAVGGGHRLPAAVSRSFKKMQDALGIWHDHVVLTDCALKLSLKSLISHHDAAVQRSVLDVAKSAMLKSQRQLSKFAKLWNARGETLAATIRQAFPLASADDGVAAPLPLPFIESKADPGPSDSAPSAGPADPAPAANETSAA